MKFSKLIYIAGIASTTLVGFACGNSSQEVASGSEKSVTSKNALNSPAAAVAPVCRESAGKTAVSISWKETLGAGAVREVGDSLVARVVNNTRVAQKGRVVAAAAGLDGRVVERPVATFSLAPGASQEVSLPVKALPVQSEVAISLAALQVELDGPVGKVRPSSTNHVHYIFSGGYTRAEFYTPAEVHRLPSGGLRTTNLMGVRGRVLDAEGIPQEVNADSTVASGGARQGLTAVNIAPKDWVSYSSGVPSVAPKAMKAVSNPLADDILENFYFYWLLGYSDSGLGEDYFWNVWWASSAHASFASLIITDENWETYYYYGQLGWIGETGNISVPANTTLYATIFTYTQDYNGTVFASQYNDGYGEGLVAITTAFSTGGSLAITIPFNDEAVQTAAVAGPSAGVVRARKSRPSCRHYLQHSLEHRMS